MLKNSHSILLNDTSSKRKKNEYCIYGQLKLIAKLTGRVCIIKIYTALFVIFSVFWRQRFLFLTLFQIQKSSFSF